jgi:predicted porin
VAQPEAKLAGVGYNYNFSKRTTFMTRYASLKNNAASNFAMNGSGLPTGNVSLATANNDPKGFSAGLRHTF